MCILQIRQAETFRIILYLLICFPGNFQVCKGQYEGMTSFRLGKVMKLFDVQLPERESSKVPSRCSSTPESFTPELTPGLSFIWSALNSDLAQVFLPWGGHFTPHFWVFLSPHSQLSPTRSPHHLVPVPSTFTIWNVINWGLCLFTS